MVWAHRFKAKVGLLATVNKSTNSDRWFVDGETSVPQASLYICKDVSYSGSGTVTKSRRWIPVALIGISYRLRDIQPAPFSGVLGALSDRPHGKDTNPGELSGLRGRNERFPRWQNEIMLVLKYRSLSNFEWSIIMLLKIVVMMQRGYVASGSSIGKLRVGIDKPRQQFCTRSSLIEWIGHFNVFQKLSSSEVDIMGIMYRQFQTIRAFDYDTRNDESKIWVWSSQ